MQYLFRSFPKDWRILSLCLFIPIFYKGGGSTRQEWIFFLEAQRRLCPYVVFFVFRTERETNLGWYILQTLASLCWLVSSLCSVTHVLHVTLFFPPLLSPTHTHLPHHQQPPSHQPTHLLSNGDQWMMEGCAMNMEQTQQTNSAMRCSTILTWQTTACGFNCQWKFMKESEE